MLQVIDIKREGFLCPECHQDMGNAEILHQHFQNVHMKQTSTTAKGLFSLAKQKIKHVQDSFKNSNDSSEFYTQYFSCSSSDYCSKQQYMGYTRSYTHYFESMRRNKVHQMSVNIKQLLLRVELLTNTNEHIPPPRNTKERRKYEQSLVAWMEDSIVSICSSCSKSFGLYRRKHHCRLDGSVICNLCSQFLSFSIASRYLLFYRVFFRYHLRILEWIINLNLSSFSITDELSFQRLINHKGLTSSTIANDGLNEDTLRICVSCTQILQRYYKKIYFMNTSKDELFHHYEKIVQAQKEYENFHPIYSTIIDSLLSGSIKYQITDAHQAYRQLRVSYEKIDSISKRVVLLADNYINMNDNDTASKDRYVALCQNIRSYSIQVLQNFAISTRHMLSIDDIKRARNEKQRLDNERLTEAILNITGINSESLELSEELEPFIQQYYQVIQFIQHAELIGHDDEVQILTLNLKELEQAIKAIKNKLEF